MLHEATFESFTPKRYRLWMDLRSRREAERRCPAGPRVRGTFQAILPHDCQISGSGIHRRG